MSQSCCRPKQGTSSHDTARFKWTLSETPWWCDVVGMCLQEQTNIWSHTSVNQYDSMCTTGYRKHPQTNGYRWLQILGQWKFPGAPCIQDSEHRSCKTLFHFHFERSGGSLGTNTSILPSTLEDHHEPDSGTVQSNKELVVKKNSFQNEKKGYKGIQWLLAKTWPFIEIDETVLKSESVLLDTDKQLWKTSWW